LRAFDNNKPLDGIKGIIFKHDGKIIINERRPLIENLDDLPLPARHLYQPLDIYRPSILAYKRLPATGIITSRGCAHKCVFCHSGKGRFKLRFHSAEYVLEEIKRLKMDFGINELIIFDEATSSLDSLTEKEITKIIQLISRERPNLMTVLVAHRLSTVQHATRIHVLERGRIIETGTHHELLNSRGLYAALFREQSAGSTQFSEGEQVKMPS